MIWFTADWHIGHQNIIDYCNRPFANADKMRHTILANYNKDVAPDDTVYFLGDLTLVGPANKNYLLNLTRGLPGNKHLILGNHDKLNPFDYVDGGFLTVHTALDIGDFVLIHDPVGCHVQKNRKWLCGHIHTLFKMNTHGNVLNIGIDQWGFHPVNLDEVNKAFEEDILIREYRRFYEETVGKKKPQP